MAGVTVTRKNRRKVDRKHFPLNVGGGRGGRKKGMQNIDSH